MGRHELLEARPRAAAVARPDCCCLRRLPERRSPTPVAGDVAHPIEPGNPAIGSDTHAVDALAADEGDPPRPSAPGAEGRHRVIDHDDFVRDAQPLDPALQQPHVAWVVGAGKREDTDCRRTIHWTRRPRLRAARAAPCPRRGRPPGARPSARAPPPAARHRQRRARRRSSSFRRRRRGLPRHRFDRRLSELVDAAHRQRHRRRALASSRSTTVGVTAGQPWSSTTAPSPTPRIPSRTRPSSPSAVAPSAQSSLSTCQPDVSVAGRRDRSEHPRIRCPVAERATEPRPRVDAAGLADRLLGAPDVVSDALVGEMRHPPVVVAVTADHVAAFHQCVRHRGNRFDPAALQEERGTCADSREHLEQPLGPNRVRAVGVLRIERQCHPHCHAEKPTSRRR